MVTIAEGIETEEQFECLKRLGCDQVQGYLIGKPMPASKLKHLHDRSGQAVKAVGQGSDR